VTGKIFRSGAKFFKNRQNFEKIVKKSAKNRKFLKIFQKNPIKSRTKKTCRNLPIARRTKIKNRKKNQKSKNFSIACSAKSFFIEKIKIRFRVPPR